MKSLLVLRRKLILVIIGTLLLLPLSIQGTPVRAAGYQLVGSFSGYGSKIASAVGPGPTNVSGETYTQRYYRTYAYTNSQFQLVEIDPNSLIDSTKPQVQVFTSPTSSEQDALALTPGPKGDTHMYLGTGPDAHIMKFDPTQPNLQDLGSVPHDPTWNVGQAYIYQLGVNPYDQAIYGCTYPSADVVVYNPNATPTVQNLGTVDPSGNDQLAETCVSDPNPSNDYIYVGAGVKYDEVIAFVPKGAPKVLLPLSGQPTFPGQGQVILGNDGDVYATLHACSAPCTPPCYYKLQGGSVDTTDGCKFHPVPAPTNVFSTGDTMAVNDTQNPFTVTLTTTSGTATSASYAYPGGKLPVYRLAIGTGPDGTTPYLYGSSALPADFLQVNLTTNAITSLGLAGGGQLYSLLSYNKDVYMAGYSSIPFGRYDPSQPPWNPGTNPVEDQPDNLHAPPLQVDWRPEAMVYDPADGKIYVGAIAGYGLLTGSLTLYDPTTISQYLVNTPVSDEGVTSLAVANDIKFPSTGTIGTGVIGGTTIYGGDASGSPTQTQADIFIWNPSPGAVNPDGTYPMSITVGTDQVNLVTITDLIEASNGYVYGIGQGIGQETTDDGYYAFAFNAQGHYIAAYEKLPPALGAPQYNSLGVGPNNYLYGLASQGIFRIDWQSQLVNVTVIDPAPPAPGGITGGFAIAHNGSSYTLYLASANTIYSYALS